MPIENAKKKAVVAEDVEAVEDDVLAKFTEMSLAITAKIAIDPADNKLFVNLRSCSPEEMELVELMRTAWLELDPETALQAMLTQFEMDGTNMSMYLDGDRKMFCNEMASLVAYLDLGQICGNSHNKLVVGLKGAEKSSFLQALVAATQLVTNSTLAIYLNISSLGTDLSIVEHVADVWNRMYGSKLELPTRRAEQVKALLEALSAPDTTFPDGRRLLIIIDEFQALYSEDTFNHQSCLAQVASLTNSTRGRTVTIVAGSSAYLRELCFAERESPWPEFPGYKGSDHNLRRASVRTLG